MKFKVKRDRAALNEEVRGERARAYPSLAEFADAFYWRERGNPKPMEDYLARIDAVKAAHPKAPL